MMNIHKIRKNFPFLKQDLTYFDSAATSLKPETVISKEAEYYRDLSVNINRGTSKHNYETSNLIENTREKVANYIGAKNSSSIVFTSNTTESINLIANGYVKDKLTPGSNIVITQLEHHSNYAPWIRLANDLNIECRIAKLEDGHLKTERVLELIDNNTVITSITGMSNLTGEVTDIKKVAKKCKDNGSKILVDAAQLITHSEINIEDLGADFLCFSSHKIYGTFGLGVLYIKQSIINEVTPPNIGGNTISYITKDNKIQYKENPHRLEYGTRNSAGIYAFNEVLNFIDKYPIKEKEKYIIKLSSYFTAKLIEIPGIKIYSVPGPIISFNILGIHPHDASEIFSKNNIIVRTGNLCASPFFMDRKETGVIRVSLDIFNTKEEIDKLLNTILEIKDFFNEFI